MSAGQARFLEIRGESFVTLETAAACYQVETRWVHEVYALGLIGPGEPFGGSIAVPARALDRVAAILRWQRHHGLDLEVVMALLAD